MKIPALVALSAAALLTLSACGNGSNSVAARPAAATGSNAGSALSTGQTSLGKVLVDSRGMTLYTLSADSHDHSTCASQCLQFWPAVSPTKGAELSVTTGRTTTPDGTAIATVAGHPVYTFSLDHKPGDVNGEGIKEFGGTWYAVSPSGQAITAAGQSPSGGSSSGTTGRGYGY